MIGHKLDNGNWTIELSNDEFEYLGKILQKFEREKVEDIAKVTKNYGRWDLPNSK